MRVAVRRVQRNEGEVANAIAAAGGSLVGEDVALRCLRLLLEAVETGEVPSSHAFAPLAVVGTRAAADGVELAVVLASLAAAVREGWRALTEVATDDEVAGVATAAISVLGVSEAVVEVVSSAFVEERLHLAAAVQSAEWALVDAVLGGRPTATAVVRAGRSLDAAYGVLLLAGTVARPHLREFEDAVAALGEGRSLWRLTAVGANVLVPVSRPESSDWLAAADGLLADLSRAAGGAPLVGSVAWGHGPDGVARAGDDAVTVLRLVTGMRRPPGLYRLDDVLLEAALSGAAAGPAARLAALLVPLEETGGTELLATLDTYVAHDADRRRTAAALHVHPNTLDYRLRRIGEITGYSPGTARGLQVLGAALTLRRVGGIRVVSR